MGETITIRTSASTDVIKVVEQGPQGPAGSGGAGDALWETGVVYVELKSGGGPGISIPEFGFEINAEESFITSSADLSLNGSIIVRENSPRLVTGIGTNITIQDGPDSGAFSGGSGGTINLSGGSAANVAQGFPAAAGGNSGSINLSGGSPDMQGTAGVGGSIDLSASGDSSGGSIDLSGGGGSINTRGTGSIGLGNSGTRTTLTGTATADRAISLPNASGTLALTSDFAAPPAIGSTTPAAGSFTTLTSSSDTEVTDSTKGVILKSPNNTRWRITINDDGTLSRAALALMTMLAFATSGMAQVRDMVTDTNGNIVTGRTNTLVWSNNLRFTPLTSANAQTAIIGTNGALSAGSVPSGAAANGSLLTADGSGSSSFVANRTVARTTTNAVSYTNNTTYAPLSDLNVTLDANSFYQVSIYIPVTAPSSGGLKVQIVAPSLPAAATNAAFGFVTTHNAASPIGRVAQQSTNIVLIGSTAVAASGASLAGVFSLATGTNGGTASVEAAQSTSNGTATTIHAGAYISYTKLN